MNTGPLHQTKNMLVVGEAWHGACDSHAKCDLFDGADAPPHAGIVRVYGATTEDATVRARQVAAAVNTQAEIVEVLRLSARNVASLIYNLPVNADATDRLSLETWERRLVEAIDKAESES